MDSFVIILVIVLALIAGVGGVFFALYAVGMFNYLGGKKRNPNAVDKETLRNRLLALNDDARPYQIVTGSDTDLVAEWKFADARWYGIFNKNALTSSQLVSMSMSG